MRGGISPDAGVHYVKQGVRCLTIAQLRSGLKQPLPAPTGGRAPPVRRSRERAAEGRLEGQVGQLQVGLGMPHADVLNNQ